MGTQPVNAVRYRFIVPAHSVHTRVAPDSRHRSFVLLTDEAGTGSGIRSRCLPL
jgi:hypothetical protein